MITLAQIMGLDYGTNLCRVRVPLLEQAGSSAVILEATMLLPPGIHSGYKVNDVVFLSFTDNDLGRPIVLGQLYLGNTENIMAADQAGSISCEFLEVENELRIQNQKLTEVLSTLSTRIATLESTVATQAREIENLKLKHP
jgi:hypothetical protein